MLALAPSNMTPEEAAPVPGGGLTALLALRKLGVRGGQKVVIYGASGSVGTYAVQLAKAFGAEVTGVCSAANAELVADLGADHVIDYQKEDFTQGGDAYDVILDAVGKLTSARRKRALVKGGRSMNVNSISGRLRPEDLVSLTKRIEEGQLRSVIDRRYPLEEIVEAHRYAELGHKKGNVVIVP